jgi:hypothetical protein
MKFLCIVFCDESKLNALPQQESQALDDESLNYDDVLRRGGHLIAANALQRSHKAKTLRKQKGKVAVTDGPFAETKEQIGGFLLIEAKDMSEAVELASKIPPVRLGGIEVRPIQELRHSSAQPG